MHALVRDRARASELEELGVRLFVGTIGDPNEVAAAARDCDIVVHAAALTDRLATLKELGWTNVAGTENVIKAAKHVGCRRMVHLSCADVSLQRGRRLNWNESRSPAHDPPEPYATTKLRAEELVIGGGDERLETVALRPAWVWGAGDTSSLPAVAREGLAGGVWIVGEGQHFFPTTHVENLVDATVLASHRPAAKGGVYHILDNELSLAADFFGDLARSLGLPGLRSLGSFPVAYALAWLRRLGGGEGAAVADLLRRGQSTSLDQQRAFDELGYRPRVTVEEGMRELSEWVRAQGGIEAIASLDRIAYADGQGAGASPRGDTAGRA